MAEVPQANRSAGFLLIEVVVALAIVAMAFAYGFRALSGSLDRLSRDHNSTAALLLAQSTLDRVGYDIAVRQGDISGSTRDGYSWSIEMAPYASAPVPVDNVLIGYVVRVTVGWKERSNTRQVQLSTIRLAYRG